MVLRENLNTSAGLRLSTLNLFDAQVIFSSEVNLKETQ
jgi:hypothetical protein